MYMIYTYVRVIHVYRINPIRGHVTCKCGIYIVLYYYYYYLKYLYI